jgi:integrase
MGVSIRERKKGSGEWWIFINHRGTRKAKKIGKDKRLAREVAQKIEAKLTLGDLDIENFNRQVPTLKKYSEQWFQLPNKAGEITLRKYRRNLEMHVYPLLGNRQIDQVKRKDFKAMFDGLLTKGMAESTFQTIKSPLSKIFNHAIDAELIEVNPLSRLNYSKQRSIDIKPLSEEDAFTFLDAAKDHEGGIFYPHFLTLLRTGQRIGELLGLQWNDFDFENRQVTIQRHIYKGVLVEKTKNGTIRTVDLTPHLSETIKALKREKQKAALRSGVPFCKWCFTFGNRTNPMSPPVIRNAMLSILKKAGLPKMRVHNTRHSYATIRLLKGHDVGDVSYQMGHSSIRITLDCYVHWLPGKFKSQVDDLDMQPSATHAQPKKVENEN